MDGGDDDRWIIDEITDLLCTVSLFLIQRTVCDTLFFHEKARVFSSLP
jgi:hypothetical protein